MDSQRRGSLNPSVASLLGKLEILKRKTSGEHEATCLITDSRRVVPGAIFFAINGLRTNGNHFIEEAVDRGAVGIVTEEDLGSHFPIDFFQVADARQALAEVSKLFYGQPDTQMGISGITGTNGKTTVSILTQHLMGGQESVGLLGTVRYDLGRRTLPSFKTTPESVDVYALLSEMVKGGCKEAVMEISSHGIDQKRVYGLEVDVAAFLNLTQDHIDYHESMEAYYQVKRRLFTGETGSKPDTAVINFDCAYGRRLASELSSDVDVISFGIQTDCAIRADKLVLDSDGARFELTWPDGSATVHSPLLGRYNVSNLLAALSIAYAKGFSLETLLTRIEALPGVPGRMERILAGQNYNVLVDYAHTDDALKNACGLVRDVTQGKVITVFGCGGDRDRSKRALMTRAVLEGSDLVIATSDNPRRESVEQIFADMQTACGSESEGSIQFVVDRKRAISMALDLAGPDDCVLIAGKGHETYQEFDGTVIPFDDRQVARELIELKNLNSGAK
jgi:UDP-N-acetylmuramoyl-L-alanyl-D-glutamate--2,6-diaminopimelate ligase